QSLQLDEADRDLDALEALVKGCFASDDYIEGRRAFMEKRKPKFTGR
ncbi:MAG: enoyl-CoA hydratase, partial [Candidatus Puniceispirillaceae bacterium]